MSFETMRDLGPFLLPEAQAYSQECLARSRVAVSAIRNKLDVPYGSHPDQQLDIFFPDRDEHSMLPVIVFFHGGAWRHGYKEWHGFMAPPLVTAPAIFISANYRLAPSVKFPVLLEDCCDAVAWVWKNIEALGGDPDRLFVAGHSAGGHLAALLTLRRDCLVSRGLPRNCVKGCLPISAVFDVQRNTGYAAGLPTAWIDFILEAGSKGAEYSPVNYVAENTTPFFVTYGSRDEPFVIEQSQVLTRLLARHGCVFEEHVSQSSSHFETNLLCADENSQWVRTARRWLAEGWG